MTDPAIPMPAQIRKMPVTSVKALTKALRKAGLTVTQGGSHLRVTTADDVLIGTVPVTPSCPRSLLNSRAWLARRLAEIESLPEGGNG